MDERNICQHTHPLIDHYSSDSYDLSMFCSMQVNLDFPCQEEYGPNTPSY
jgi:hypothetical protein